MPQTQATDYVVVGGGSAGCVLAHRLSEDPGVQVTLIEAGGWDSNPLIRMPAGFLGLMRTGFVNWRYNSDPQENLGGRVLYAPRGKVLGGSSSINGMVYARGDASDYDHWAQLGNRGWSYDECLPLFAKAETYERGPLEGRGSSGPLRTSRKGVESPLAKAFLAAGEQLGHPYNDDFNMGDQEGFGPVDSTISDSRRWSTATGYLHPIKDRPNLTILTKALATRILIENGRAVGVEVVRGGNPSVVRAEREVILSGGAINSPQLLQLSGIGDGDHLRGLGISVTHELPGVGQNLQDHPAASLKQTLLQPISLLPQTKPLRAALATARYVLTGQGPGAHHGLEAMAFLKTRPEVICPDLQYFFIHIMYENNGRTIIDQHGFMLYFTLQRPESRGSIMIKSADPNDAPAIDLNYFDRPIDLETMREGIRMGREIVAQTAFDELRGEEYGPGAAATTDEAIDDYIRRTVVSNYHLSGTCKMGADEHAVVDERLRVRGLAGLRVIDASIMPTVVSGNTNAPTIMIAEKGSEMIRADRG
ncbi:MAG: choline dehydrogenase [Pseudomonadota bacterium]